MSERVVITGGAGFLGTALARSLCERYDVVLLDNLLRDALAHTDLLAGRKVRLIRADVCDARAVGAALQGATRVVHLAGVAGVDAVERDPIETMRINVVGADTVLQAAVAAGSVERVVLASSSEVYGPQAAHVREEDVRMPGDTGAAAPRWSYALSKLAAEHLGLACHREGGLPVCIVRPFNVYGPGQVGQGAVHTFVRRALAGEPLELIGGGDQIRAWCFISDLVAGLEQAMGKPAAVGEVFNLGNPDAAVTVRELAERVAAIAGTKAPVIAVAPRGPDVVTRIPDIDRARRLLGFAPRIGLERGLTETVAWYRDHAAPGREVAHG